MMEKKWNNGIMEYWNNAKIIKSFKPNIPLFQHSNIPAYVPSFHSFQEDEVLC